MQVMLFLCNLEDCVYLPQNSFQLALSFRSK